MLVTHISDTLGFNSNEIRKSIEANSQNTHTTTYKLMLKKWLLQGKDSFYDYNSEKFDPTLLKRPQVKSESMEVLGNKKSILDKTNTNTCVQLGGKGDPSEDAVLHASTGGTSSIDGKKKKMRVTDPKENKLILETQANKLRAETLDQSKIVIETNQIHVDKAKTSGKHSRQSSKRRESLGKKLGFVQSPGMLPKIDSGVKENSRYITDISDYQVEIVY